MAVVGKNSDNAIVITVNKAADFKVVYEAVGNAVIAAAWSGLGALGREELSLTMLVALVVPVAAVWGIVRTRWATADHQPPLVTPGPPRPD